MKFGRRGFLKGLGSLAAAWMVKPKLPKLEEQPEVEEENEEEPEQVFAGLDKIVTTGKDWPTSCELCWRYACSPECPCHAVNPYRLVEPTYGSTWFDSWPDTCATCKQLCHGDCPNYFEVKT